MPDEKAALVALNRFGFGARPGDLAKAARDPRGFLHADLDRPGTAIIPLAGPGGAVGLLSSTIAFQHAFADLEQRAKARAAPSKPASVNQAGDSATGSMAGAAPQKSEGGAAAKPARGYNVEQLTFRAEATARFDKTVTADSGFVERLVAFWSNHFCVSALKSPELRMTAGAFEREAIRPFVLGRFADMLRAVIRHPSMLLYLDNQLSVGPDSRAGRHRGRGLNENLAREILELHTLGVGSGYTQADVTSFARVLTGWTMVGRAGKLGEPGSFVFNGNAHEPGDERVLGKTYPAGGEGQGETVLDDIARHPATAKHIATKLARHFVADDPPPGLVARLSRSFEETGGDLLAAARLLVDAPEAWSAPPTKARSPYDFLLAAQRALHPGPVGDPGPILAGLNVLGQPLWQPPGPNGFPDHAGAWISAEGMKTRLDIAAQIGGRAKDGGRPRDLADMILGPGISAATGQAIGRAESRQQAIAILLMSPEFQRR